jgi:hypothetical protein
MNDPQSNELKWLQSVAAEPIAAPPDVDVTADVMRTLRQRRSAPATHMLLAVALASWALAAVSVVMAQQAISAWQDPLANLLRF